MDVNEWSQAEAFILLSTLDCFTPKLYHLCNRFLKLFLLLNLASSYYLWHIFKIKIVGMLVHHLSHPCPYSGALHLNNFGLLLPMCVFELKPFYCRLDLCFPLVGLLFILRKSLCAATYCHAKVIKFRRIPHLSIISINN